MRPSIRSLSISLAAALVVGSLQTRVTVVAQPSSEPKPDGTPAAPPLGVPPAPQPPPATPPPAAATDVLNDPEIKKQLEGKTPDEARAWAAQMSAKGLKRLPYDDLVAWNEIRMKMAASSPTVCAGFWKGGIDGAQVQKALSSLGKDDVDRWTTLSTRAMALEAKNTPYPETSPDDIPQLTKLVMSDMSEPDRTKFQTLAGKASNITDEEACWLMTAMLRTAGHNTADQKDKERFLRAFAALGSPK